MGSKEVVGGEESTKSKVVKWATIVFFIFLFSVPFILGLVLGLERFLIPGITAIIMLSVLVLNGFVVLSHPQGVGYVKRFREPTGRVIERPGINFVLPLVDEVSLLSVGLPPVDVIIKPIYDNKGLLRFVKVSKNADKNVTTEEVLQEKGHAKKTVPLVFSLPVLIVGTIVVVVWLIWLGQPPKTVDVKEEAVVVLLQGFKKPTKVKRKDLPLGILYFKGPPSASVNVQFVEDKCWPRNNVIRAKGDIRTFFKEIPQEVNEIHFFGPKGLKVEIRKKN